MACTPIWPERNFGHANNIIYRVLLQRQTVTYCTALLGYNMSINTRAVLRVASTEPVRVPVLVLKHHMLGHCCATH
jgi:hypothetical protein